MEQLQQAAGEFFQERWAQLVVAFLFAGVGAYITALRNRRRTADRIAMELIATHAAMLDRAFPYNGWRESDPRQQWMLEPYVRRVDFLKHLAKDNGLSTDAVAQVRQYELELQRFVETWSNAQRRRNEFHRVFDTLTQSLQAALRTLRRLRRHRNDPVWRAIQAASGQVQEEQRVALEAGPHEDLKGASSVIQDGPRASSDSAEPAQPTSGEGEADKASQRL